MTSGAGGAETSRESPGGRGGGSIAVVVVNFASSHLLAANLAPFTGPASSDAHIILVDNYSSDEEQGRVRQLASERGWHAVLLADNRGFSAGVNAGVRAGRAAGHRSFLLLNPDAVIRPDVVTELRRHVEAAPLDLVSPRVLSASGGWDFEGSAMSLADGRAHRATGPEDLGPGEFPWLSGACVAVHDELLQRVGELDERFFMYWEDVDLSYRALQAGGRIRVRADLTAGHDEGGTQARTGRAKSALYYRYNCRNRLVFAAVHLDRRTTLRWMLLAPRVGWEILLRGGRRQLLHSRRPLLAAAGGTVTGLWHAGRSLVHRPAPRPPVSSR